MYSWIRLGVLSVALGILLAPASQAAGDKAFQKEVNQAIARGVAYLKQIQQKDGTWVYSQVANVGGGKAANVGATALAGLALLESGAPARDEAIQSAAEAIRPLTTDLTYTYSLALAIMFLDRLGDPGDVPLIESMTVRLLGGQGRSGGWSYQCPAIDASEVQRLLKAIKQRNELVSRGKLPKVGRGKRRTEKDLPKEILGQLVQLNRRGLAQLGTEDNSNTQFATLALWIARRHGLPVDMALARIDARFRSSQALNGGWGYRSFVNLGGRMIGYHNPPNAAMTCSGLLGLAVAHGAINNRVLSKNAKRKSLPSPNKDPAIKGGLIALASCIGEPAGQDKKWIPNIRSLHNKAYYFLWSLERVGVVYGLSTIGKKDWYRWGAEILLANQQVDGSWRGGYAEGGADTSFGLLFLSRSNLAPDLTSSLKGTIDRPGENLLKSGGVGGEALVGRKLGKGIEPGINGKSSSTKEDGGPTDKKTPVKIQLPTDDRSGTIARLSTELLRAAADEQERLIAKMQKSKGLVYTEALAGSIPLLQGNVQQQARAALAARMKRMSVGTLRDKFQDDNLEVRRAAALACLEKKSQAPMPELIGLLQDPELAVAEAAHHALTALSGKDFGPAEDATRAERRQAVARWQKWWKKQRMQE
jgi:hypothetical protein